MTREDDFIRQLESYLDEYEGLTPLPDVVRDAVRAELPTTKQAGPGHGLARYLNMITSNKAVQYGLAAAAVLLVAVGAFALGGRNTGDEPPPNSSQMPSASAVASAEACTASDVSATAPGRIDVVWCVPRSEADTLTVAFTVEAPADWAQTWFGGTRSLYLRPPRGAIALTLTGAESAEAWVDDVTGRNEYEASEPEAIDFDGAAGYTFDVRLAPGVSSGDAPPLFEDPEQAWRLQPDNQARAWVFERDAEVLAFVTGAAPANFDQWAGEVGTSLETLQWVP